MIGLKKVWMWLKNYWYFPVIGIAVIAAVIIYRRVPLSLLNIIEKQRNAHREETEALESIRKEELAKRENALKKYHETIEEIEEKYKKQQKELTKREKRKLKKLIEKEPEKLTEVLAKEFGLNVLNSSHE